jgi:ubiquinone/menaquinone biosynthesis C-methylase UbiE
LDPKPEQRDTLTESMATASTATQLHQTREAFDSVAADYDGPRGNNALIQDMREETWRWLDATFAPGSRLIDLGCGTGLDAVRMARHGHRITATDWSPQMVVRTRERALREGLAERVQTLAVGAHELERLGEDGAFDGAYSNLGPLNCVPDLAQAARECARLLKPRGALVFTVIGRVCPWEMAYYFAKGKPARATVRFARRVVPVGMNQRTIWTRYYTPRELYRAFKKEFTLERVRGLCLFAPPPYLAKIRERHARWYRALWHMDRVSAGLPLVRSMGDHFLIVMRKRVSRS